MDTQAFFGTVSHLHGLIVISRYQDGHPYLLSYTFRCQVKDLTNGLADVSVMPLGPIYDD